jgi:hypothetical protein
MDSGIKGVGKDAPVVTNELGAKQSATQYRMDLLPPLAILAVAEVLKQGAEKYGDNNWRNIPVSDHLNHAIIHAYAYLAGDKQDSHLEHFACRALMALETMLCKPANVTPVNNVGAEVLPPVFNQSPAQW